MKRYIIIITGLSVVFVAFWLLSAPVATAQATTNETSDIQYQRLLDAQADQAKRAETLLHGQEEVHRKAETLLATQEQLLGRQEADLTRYEKILDTWESQQKQYQKYLDSLGK